VQPIEIQPATASLGIGSRFLRSSAVRRVAQNIAALSVAQAATYLLPLVVIPYTAAVLGPKNLGLTALIQAVVQYSSSITGYGFSYSATRQAAIFQNDPQKLAEIFGRVLAAKLLLMAACFIVGALVFALSPSLRPLFLPYVCASIAVIGTAFYMDWFFQAIEEMKWMTIFNTVPKLLLTPLIFVFVKKPADYIWLLLLQATAPFLTGIAGAAFMFYRLRGNLSRPTIRAVREQFAEGWHTFLGSMSANFYTSTNTVILGSLSNATAVGYYSAAQKLVVGIQSMWSPFSQAVYPYFCKTFQSNPQRAAQNLKRLSLGVGAITLTAAIVLSLTAPYFIPAYLGPQYQHSIGIMQVLIFSVAAVTLNSILGLQGVVAAGLNSDFLRVVAIVTVLDLLLAPIGIKLLAEKGLAAAFVCAELFGCFCWYQTLKKRAIF